MLRQVLPLRESISNNLKTIGISKGITENALVFIGKNNNSRAEELSIEDFIALINIIERDKYEKL
ncbi:Uncharacterised protein [Streptobacillus moniliformis]|nr:Uncharacterised protein [Streptobacillus moniliformis]